MRPMFRIEPAAPAAAYKTYTIDRERDTAVVAACSQVGCAAWRNGWQTAVDESTDLGKSQAGYIRTRSRRTFREGPAAGGLTVFTFESGQRCFADHRTTSEHYAVVLGDWRRSFGTLRTHSRPADWVEDFGEHQQMIASQIERG